MNKILPPTYFFVCLIISALLSYAVSLFQIIHYPFSLVGFLFFIVGAGLNIWTDQLMKKMERLFIPDEEKILMEQFGEEFKTYKKNVGKWV